MSDHELADGRLRARIEQLSRADLVQFAMFSIEATRRGQGADALKSFADELIVRRVPMASHDLFASVLSSPDLMRAIIANLGTRDGGVHAACTCKTWRSAWDAVVATRKALGRAEWFRGDVPFGFRTALPIEDVYLTPMAMAVKHGKLYVFGEQIAALQADKLRLGDAHLQSRYYRAPPGEVVVSEAYSAIFDGQAQVDQTLVVDVVMADAAVYVLTNKSLLKFEGAEPSSMSLAAQLTTADMREASAAALERRGAARGCLGEQVAFDLAWNGDRLFLLLRFADHVPDTVVSVASDLSEAQDVPLPSCVDLPHKLAATSTTLIVAASAKRRTQRDGVYPFGVGAELYVLSHQGGLLRRIRIDEPHEVVLSLGMSPCEQYFVLATFPIHLRGRPYAAPKLRLFTRDGVGCSTLTIARRLCDVHYMLVTADAVHIGHSTQALEPQTGEGILRVPLAAGLSNAERKDLHGMQDLDLELTLYDEDEGEEEDYYSDEEDLGDSVSDDDDGSVANMSDEPEIDV